MIGIDTAAVERIKKALSKPAFKDRVITVSEQKYCDGRPDPFESYAGIFCAKEAAVKAVKSGFGRGVMPKDIEIGHDEYGAPTLAATGAASVLFKNYDAEVSISHDGGNAVAVVLLTDRG